MKCLGVLVALVCAVNFISRLVDCAPCATGDCAQRMEHHRARRSDSAVPARLGGEKPHPPYFEFPKEEWRDWLRPMFRGPKPEHKADGSCYNGDFARYYQSEEKSGGYMDVRCMCFYGKWACSKKGQRNLADNRKITSPTDAEKVDRCIARYPAYDGQTDEPDPYTNCICLAKLWWCLKKEKLKGKTGVKFEKGHSPYPRMRRDETTPMTTPLPSAAPESGASPAPAAEANATAEPPPFLPEDKWTFLMKEAHLLHPNGSCINGKYAQRTKKHGPSCLCYQEKWICAKPRFNYPPPVPVVPTKFVNDTCPGGEKEGRRRPLPNKNVACLCTQKKLWCIKVDTTSESRKKRHENAMRRRRLKRFRSRRTRSTEMTQTKHVRKENEISKRSVDMSLAPDANRQGDAPVSRTKRSGKPCTCRTDQARPRPAPGPKKMSKSARGGMMSRKANSGMSRSAKSGPPSKSKGKTPPGCPPRPTTPQMGPPPPWEPPPNCDRNNKANYPAKTPSINGQKCMGPKDMKKAGGFGPGGTDVYGTCLCIESKYMCGVQKNKMMKCPGEQFIPRGRGGKEFRSAYWQPIYEGDTLSACEKDGLMHRCICVSSKWHCVKYDRPGMTCAKIQKLKTGSKDVGREGALYFKGTTGVPEVVKEGGKGKPKIVGYVPRRRKRNADVVPKQRPKPLECPTPEPGFMPPPSEAKSLLRKCQKFYGWTEDPFGFRVPKTHPKMEKGQSYGLPNPRTGGLFTLDLRPGIEDEWCEEGIFNEATGYAPWPYGRYTRGFCLCVDERNLCGRQRYSLFKCPGEQFIDAKMSEFVSVIPNNTREVGWHPIVEGDVIQQIHENYVARCICYHGEYFCRNTTRYLDFWHKYHDSTKDKVGPPPDKHRNVPKEVWSQKKSPPGRNIPPPKPYPLPKKDGKAWQPPPNDDKDNPANEQCDKPTFDGDSCAGSWEVEDSAHYGPGGTDIYGKCLCVNNTFVCGKQKNRLKQCRGLQWVNKKMAETTWRPKGWQPMFEGDLIWGCSDVQTTHHCICKTGNWQCVVHEKTPCKGGEDSYHEFRYENQEGYDGRYGAMIFIRNPEPPITLQKLGTPSKMFGKSPEQQKLYQDTLPPALPMGPRTEEEDMTLAEEEKQSKVQRLKRSPRTKRQAAQKECKLANIATIQHGKTYEFGVNCICNNGNFKCQKYQGQSLNKFKRDLNKELDKETKLNQQLDKEDKRNKLAHSMSKDQRTKLNKEFEAEKKLNEKLDKKDERDKAIDEGRGPGPVSQAELAKLKKEFKEENKINAKLGNEDKTDELLNELAHPPRLSSIPENMKKNKSEISKLTKEFKADKKQNEQHDKTDKKMKLRKELKAISKDMDKDDDDDEEEDDDDDDDDINVTNARDDDEDEDDDKNERWERDDEDEDDDDDDDKDRSDDDESDRWEKDEDDDDDDDDREDREEDDDEDDDDDLERSARNSDDDDDDDDRWVRSDDFDDLWNRDSDSEDSGTDFNDLINDMDVTRRKKRAADKRAKRSKVKKKGGKYSQMLNIMEISRTKRASGPMGIGNNTIPTKGEQCKFNKNGIDIIRMHGKTFGYGMRCDCTEGKAKCANTRV